MTPSVYILGGAGAGKSTFTAELLKRMDALPLSPLQDLWMKQNAKGTPVVLRGHTAPDGGLYLGCWRDSFPGTDGLDRASSMTGSDWLERNGAATYPWVLAEGATLATRPFLGALWNRTDMLLVHLHVDGEIAMQRFAERGSDQNVAFVKSTVTRAANRLAEHRQFASAEWISVDTHDPFQWDFALDRAVWQLRKESSGED